MTNRPAENRQPEATKKWLQYVAELENSWRPFEEHWEFYKRIYDDWDHNQSPPSAWQPSRDQIAVSNIGRFMFKLGADSLSLASTDTFNEPSTGLSMGEHMEITREEWDISREEQDRIALSSHQNAVSAQAKIDHEIFPMLGQSRDSGLRPDTSNEALAALDPVFKSKGTLTAGNSSPVTDGASIVFLMSEERAAKEGRTPLAFIKAMDYAALHPDEGLLMAPALTIPRILARTGLHLRDMELIEIHEAFGAQVAANVKAWEKGWKGDPTGPVDWNKMNVNGSSIAYGHPWSATGGRIVTTLANEMARRDARFGLVSICAAGGMAGALILERP